MRAAPFLIIVGLGGAAILIALGVWQVQRLAWKQGILAEIEARIDGVPVALPAAPDPERDTYLPVEAEGVLGPGYIRVLVSDKIRGAGYRVISPLRGAGASPDDGGILVDRGFLPASSEALAELSGPVTIRGNLQWPQEVDGFTPEPDLDANIWYARDVPAMAAHFDTRPVLLVARDVSFDDRDVTPMPVDTSRIPNNHLQYAITWFSLAAIWLAMSLYFVRGRTSDAKGKG